MWLYFTYSALALSDLIIHNASTEQVCIAVMLWSCMLEVPAWILVELLAVLGEGLVSVSFIIQLHFSSCVLNGMTRWLWIVSKQRFGRRLWPIWRSSTSTYFEIPRKTAVSWGRLVTQPWLNWFRLNTNAERDWFQKLHTVSNLLQLYEVCDWSSVMKLPKNEFMMNLLEAGFIFCAKLQLCLCHSFLIEMCEILLPTSWLLLQAVVS
jgi:hypothetical protein